MQLRSFDLNIPIAILLPERYALSHVKAAISRAQGTTSVSCTVYRYASNEATMSHALSPRVAPCGILPIKVKAVACRAPYIRYMSIYRDDST